MKTTLALIGPALIVLAGCSPASIVYPISTRVIAEKDVVEMDTVPVYRLRTTTNETIEVSPSEWGQAMVGESFASREWERIRSARRRLIEASEVREIRAQR
jgi:hypothetical protein